ncbi:MAG: exodeoxyribonuclease V subunit gamma [Betaproteobacteria bacterium]|nr:exodeoxyribonuclease V subunit gamma [Betaproteobacteria bacterium]
MSAVPLAPGLMVIHGNRPELLRQLVVTWMRAHPLAPLEDEIILVHSNGIAQWLKLALAADAGDGPDAGIGIAASLATLLPSRFVWQAYRSVLGAAAVPDASPYDKQRLLWRIARLLPELARQQVFAPLAGFLAGDDDARRRCQLAERLADLLDQYQVYRAEWLAAWDAGEDVLIDARGNRRRLPPDSAWQPALWRALARDIGAGSPSRAGVHRQFLAAAADHAGRPPGLPRRVTVFGVSSLPRQTLEALAAVARWTQVLICANNPCRHYWGDITTARDLARRPRHARRPAAPAATPPGALHLDAHPLLAAWGRQGSDTLALLDEIDEADAYRERFAVIGQRIDLFAPTGGGCLLHQIQDDILDLRPAAEIAWPPVAPDSDRSLRFHIAHSAQREVEVLHDELLAARDADATLQPRDIIVMVPDIDAYAPHIEAVFGQIEPGDDRYLPYSVADRGERIRQPVVRALDHLLALDTARLTIAEVLDLLDVPALRARFGIAAGDLPLLRQWLDGAHVRWGLDAGHRRSLGIDFDYEQNTWRSGLRRMLLGYAAGSDPAGRRDCDWHGIEPFADAAGLDAALLGPLADLVDRLGELHARLAQLATPAAWGERLRGLLQDFFSASDGDDALMLLQLQESLDAWLSACAEAGLDEPLPLPPVREHWLAQIDAGSLTRRFLAGRVTFATLMPMRAIPFRIVCLLGMNDGDYPRTRVPADFDLMAGDLRPGDRSRREDDRYLFLEALLSARERLHVSWVGRSITDNAVRPPSVLVAQLRDHIDACWRLAGDTGAASRLIAALTVEHPLQPFNPAYFAGTGGLFTYAREWEATEAAPAGPSLLTLPPATLAEPVTFARLASFLRDPAGAFLAERLGVRPERDDEDAEGHEPFALDGLAHWSLQDRLIRARLDALARGEDESAAVAAEAARIRRAGSLPAGAAADAALDRAVAPIEEMFARYRTALSDWPLSLPDSDAGLVIADGDREIAAAGRLTGLRGSAAGARCRVIIGSSRYLDGKQQHYRPEKLLADWIVHLAGHLTGEPLESLLIGRNGAVQLAALDPELARGHLAELLRAFADGMRRPLPLAPGTGFAWLGAGGTPSPESIAPPAGKATDGARKAYQSSRWRQGEDTRLPGVARFYPTFADLWAGGEFSRLAAGLLAPLDAAIVRAKEGKA